MRGLAQSRPCALSGYTKVGASTALSDWATPGQGYRLRFAESTPFVDLSERRFNYRSSY